VNPIPRGHRQGPRLELDNRYRASEHLPWGRTASDELHHRSGTGVTPALEDVPIDLSGQNRVEAGDFALKGGKVEEAR